MRKFVCVLFLVSGSWFGSPAKACDNLKDYDLITNMVARKFFDSNFKGLNWSDRVAAYRQKVNCNASPRDLAKIVNLLLGELKTSHTGLYTMEDLEYWGLKSIFSGDLEQYKIPFSGIWPVQIKANAYAKFVLPGTAAEGAKVRAGDQLISLNGQPFQAVGFPVGKKSSLVLSSEGRKSRTVLLEPLPVSVQGAFLLASKQSERIFLQGHRQKIGYFHLWCGTHPEFLAALNQTLARFKAQKITKLVLDLRDGFGGANPDYLSVLTTDPYFQGIAKTFLINEGVRSGKEWLAAIVKRDKIGMLVGTKTAGAFIGGGPVDLGTDKYFLYLAMREFNPPDIPKIEGVGVDPDVIVGDCRQFCNGQDPVLEWAINN